MADLRRLVPALVMAGIVGCAASPEKPKTEGKVLFDQYCMGCHGSEGAGNFLKGIPPNRGTKLGRDAIADRVQYGGGRHGKMPGFPTLSRAEAIEIARHVLSLQAGSDGETIIWQSAPGSQ